VLLDDAVDRPVVDSEERSGGGGLRLCPVCCTEPVRLRGSATGGLV